MQLYIAGGCGDQGRNCFYIEGDRHAFIVDAGTSTDGLDRLPDLSPEMIRRAEYLFVTHSHRPRPDVKPDLPADPLQAEEHHDP